jgi:hypothetical protein
MAGRPLRHDPLKAKLACLLEHDRALGTERLAEHDSFGACDEPRERLAPRLDGPLAQVVAVETQKIEGSQRGHEPALGGQERVEVAPPVGSQRHRFAVDQRLGAAEAANHLGDPCKAIREVGAASAPDLDAFAVLKGEDAKAVVFDFMQPAETGGRVIGERWLARTDEADPRIYSPTGRWGTPR